MKITKAGVVALGILLGLAAGISFAGLNRLERKRVVAAEATRKRDVEEARLRAEHARLTVEQARLKAESAVSPSAPLPVKPEAAAVSGRREALRVLAALSKGRQIWVTPGFGGARGGRRDALASDREGKLPAAFGELFELPAGTIAELQAALDGTRERIGELVVANTTVRRHAAGAVVMEVKEAPGMAAERETLRSALVQALGADGLAAYEALRIGGFNSLFNSWGGRERTITIERTASTYAIREETDGGRGRSSSSGVNWNDIERQLGPLAKLMPPDF